MRRLPSNMENHCSISQTTTGAATSRGGMSGAECSVLARQYADSLRRQGMSQELAKVSLDQVVGVLDAGAAVFLHLDAESLRRAALVSSCWNELASIDELWAAFVLQDCP